MQVVGVVVCVAVGWITGLVMGVLLDKTIGLRVAADDQIDGLDKLYWDLEPDVLTHADAAPRT